MGAGIAALAVEAGLHTLLYDPDPEALAGAPEGVEPVRDLAAFAPCGLVIEAAPEDLEVKRALFARLADVVEPDCVLATNTSSLSVTALAAGLPHPERVIGMHFFNPPARMRWSRSRPARRRRLTRSPSPARRARRWAGT